MRELSLLFHIINKLIKDTYTHLRYIYAININRINDLGWYYTV